MNHDTLQHFSDEEPTKISHHCTSPSGFLALGAHERAGIASCDGTGSDEELRGSGKCRRRRVVGSRGVPPAEAGATATAR